MSASTSGGQRKLETIGWSKSPLSSFSLSQRQLKCRPSGSGRDPGVSKRSSNSKVWKPSWKTVRVRMLWPLLVSPVSTSPPCCRPTVAPHLPRTHSLVSGISDPVWDPNDCLQQFVSRTANETIGREMNSRFSRTSIHRNRTPPQH